MKIIFLTICSFFTASLALAGDSSVLVNYPAPSGSYNKVVLENLVTNPDCTNPTNAGVLYFNTTTNHLELCTNDGTNKAVPYPETCFNRFWNVTSATKPISPALPTACPNNYTKASTVVDSFQPDSVNQPNLWIVSTVCCSTNSIVASSI